MAASAAAALWRDKPVPLSRFTPRVGGGSAFYDRCWRVCPFTLRFSSGRVPAAKLASLSLAIAAMHSGVSHIAYLMVSPQLAQRKPSCFALRTPPASYCYLSTKSPTVFAVDALHLRSSSSRRCGFLRITLPDALRGRIALMMRLLVLMPWPVQPRPQEVHSMRRCTIPWLDISTYQSDGANRGPRWRTNLVSSS